MSKLLPIFSLMAGCVTAAGTAPAAGGSSSASAGVGSGADRPIMLDGLDAFVCGPNHGRGLSGLCDEGRLRVATYNLNYGLAGDPAGVAAVGALGADIVLLQEANDPWRDAFAATGAYPFTRFTPPTSWPASGLGVLSRFPITSVEALPGSPFDAWRIVIASDRGPVQLLNVHLRPPMSDGGSWLVGYFTTRPIREAEIQRHVAALDPKLPTIVAGDFNEELDGRAVAALFAHGFVDAVARPTEPTWRWTLGGITMRFALDHILVDRRFAARSSGVVDQGHSDHLPVWVDLWFAPAGA